ncbi:uncharacterized protein LOC109721430 [Ananas comosus]|uniref:Uncharacterized protein LOC109721430 n=1 Tax=Ananas comosus TaxID=4615 RepID=A0A6P5GFB5_ANACO|nr:uncharacterized protein LOC109721430 [Ananas comosus]
MSFPSARSISSPILRETLRQRRRGGGRRRGHGWRRRRSPKQSGRRKEMKRVAEKLEALKLLIPSSLRSHGGGGGGAAEAEAEAELLLEEAAGYIERLRSQVQILKHLVDFYGAGEGNAAAAEEEE